LANDALVTTLHTFPTMKRELQGKKFGSVRSVRSASLDKGGTSKKETVTAPPQSSDSE
jgi:hypothetical protein